MYSKGKDGSFLFLLIMREINSPSSDNILSFSEIIEKGTIFNSEKN